MYNTDQPKETARERAMRKWRNNQIIKESQATGQEEPIVSQQQFSKMRLEILRIFEERSINTIEQYWIALELRRRKLLKEKLRRLKECKDE